MMFKLKLLCVLIVGFLEVCIGTQVDSGRVRRGASVYPVFGGGNQGHSGAGQNSYLSQNDAAPFIHYLGGGGGSSSPHSGGGQGSSYSFQVRSPPAGGQANHALESNLINSYAMHSSSQPSWSPSPSSSGWQPSSSGWQTSASGYGGGHYIPYFGLTTPNFASTGQSSSPPAHGAPPAPRHETPQPDATSLLHAAQSTFNSQTALFNVLTAGSTPRRYKGGY